MELKKCQENDNIAKTKYQEELKIYENRMAEIEKNISKLEKLEIQQCFNVIKALLADPNPVMDTIFSKRMRSVAATSSQFKALGIKNTLQPDLDLIKEFPCQRYYKIIIRTKNEKGGFVFQGYCFQFTDEKFTDVIGPFELEISKLIDDENSIFYSSTLFSASTMFKGNACDDSKFFNPPSEPIYQYEMKKNRKPIFDKFNFKYSN
jgi:hypothetical protein